MKPLPDYGDHMTLDEFVRAAESHSFIDYDGTGYYATAESMSDKIARPSEIAKGIVDRTFTHVMWFNK